MASRRPLIAGNWKMNGLLASLDELKKIAAGAATLSNVELMVCPPATLIADFAAAANGSGVLIGAQDCHALPAGAYTGDISAEMLKDAGAVAVIVGHSERRQYHGETDAAVRAKGEAASRAGIVAIVCVGETRAERQSGRELEVVGTQLEGSLSDDSTGFAIAYEPVWAIGTGLTPTPGDVRDMHRFIRKRLGLRFGHAARDIRILYGGSVNPGNARELLAVDNVDGALVGGASLKAADFLAIAGACG
jgi:triosephosphate isomerase (TIM)